jgi:transposase
MNTPHKNVRTTFYSRALLVKRARKQGTSVKKAAAQQGISRYIVYKWLGRDK